MSEQAATRSIRTSGTIGLPTELLRTTAGRRRQPAIGDHRVSLHLGAPVRLSCLPSNSRCVRTRGDINVIPAGVAEDWIEDDASETVELRLPAPLVRFAAEQMGLDPDRAGIVGQCHARDPHIEHIARALAVDEQASAPNGLLYRESLGMALAVHLLARYRSAAAPRSLTRGEVARVTDYIEAHLSEDVSLARLARVAGVSASHLRALFKRSVGVPVHEYVIRRRVERARTLLVRGELSSGQIAAVSGFAHQSHMARCMRRVLGVTPAAITRSRA